MLMSLPTPLDDQNGDDADPERYRVVSVEPVPAPEGCAGADWFVYRIAQGVNEITGYRRGTREAVRADVDTIVAGLNDRRSRIKPSSKAQRRAASQIRLGGA
jgi:hypothetical protein